MRSPRPWPDARRAPLRSRARAASPPRGNICCAGTRSAHAASAGSLPGRRAFAQAEQNPAVEQVHVSAARARPAARCRFGAEQVEDVLSLAAQLAVRSDAQQDVGRTAAVGDEDRLGAARSRALLLSWLNSRAVTIFSGRLQLRFAAPHSCRYITTL
jgi:hypothetical protein